MPDTNKISVNHTFDFGESWMAKNWRPLAAVVYLFICVADFVALPVYYEWMNNRYTPDNLVELSLKYPAPMQIEVLKALKAERNWQPITLTQNALFHMVFGAILGVSAWSRGNDKQAQYISAMKSVASTSTDVPK